uniref:G-protein coupled receptors family 1 profile domain-containing protein n=1 Tax=Biomphalaria glabrata TaxID=6526 RepID=A0A2C9KWX3_BIOGL
MVYTLTSVILMPIISLTGVTGNVISVIIISRDGLHRCSNVLICVLAVADSMYLIGLNNVVNIMLGEDITFVCRPYDWVAHLIYLSNNIFAMLESTGMIVSMLVPTLIVIERFVAVFFPFHFTKIVTLWRVRLAAICLFPISLPVFLLTIPVYWNMGAYICRSLMARSPEILLAYMSTKMDIVKVHKVVLEIYSAICGPVSVCLVIFGCILISVKIHSQQRVRHKMIRCQGWEGKHNKDADKGAESFRSNKTTKILISVCCVYSITGAFSFLSDLVFTSEFVGAEFSFWIHKASMMLVCINSTANFIIYVAFNRKFREAYMSMCFCGSSRTVKNK